MPGADFAGTFDVQVAGAPLSNDVATTLSLAYVDDNLHVPDMFVLRFRDPDRLVLADGGFTIGAPVKLRIKAAGHARPQVLLHGEVTALEAEVDGEGTFTVVRGYDRSHRLCRGTRVETYKNMSYSDIARRVATRAGLRPGTIRRTGTVYPHVTQGGVDDWAFLQRLADEVGYEVLVEDEELSFQPATAAAGAPPARRGAAVSPYVIKRGDDLLSLRTSVTAAEQVPSVEVRSWDPDKQTAAHGSAPAKTTTADLSVTPAAWASTFRAPPYLGTHGLHRQRGEADKAAAAIADQIAGGFAELEGVVRGNPRLRAGDPVSVDGLGAPFDGKYTLSRVRHVFEPNDGYTTSISVTGQQERSLLGIIGRATDHGDPPGVSGVAVGVVDDVRDPLGLGRVKLKLPWMADDYITDWAPTVQSGAGRNRGSVVLPEVGDQVLVAFEQGNLDRPYAVGGLYSTPDKPPMTPLPVDGGTGKVVRRAFVSRTGHKLEFLELDNRADQGVSLVTGDGKLQLALDTKTTKVSVTSDGTVVIDAARGVRITSAHGDIELSGNKVTVAGRSGVSVDGGAECAITAALVKIN